jgi:zinc transporter ZupT
MISWWEMAQWALITFATPLIIALFPFFRVKIGERVLHLMLGFSAGILGGVTFVDILPEAFAIAKELSILSVYVSSGVGVGFFVLLLAERYLLGLQEIHGRHFIHDSSAPDPSRGLMAVGALTFHGFMDGFVIPMGFSAGPAVGIIVSLAITLHQIPDSFAALALSLRAASSRKQIFFSVLATAADTPVGIVFGLLLVSLGNSMIPFGLGLSAGTFIYVSAVDIVPELQHETRSKLVLLSMTLGFLLVSGLSLILPQV